MHPSPQTREDFLHVQYTHLEWIHCASIVFLWFTIYAWCECWIPYNSCLNPLLYTICRCVRVLWLLHHRLTSLLLSIRLFYYDLNFDDVFLWSLVAFNWPIQIYPRHLHSINCTVHKCRQWACAQHSLCRKHVSPLRLAIQPVQCICLPKARMHSLTRIRHQRPLLTQ